VQSFRRKRRCSRQTLAVLLATAFLAAGCASQRVELVEFGRYVVGAEP
jgi:hypothetical protein